MPPKKDRLAVLEAENARLKAALELEAENARLRAQLEQSRQASTSAPTRKAAASRRVAPGAKRKPGRKPGINTSSPTQVVKKAAFGKKRITKKVAPEPELSAPAAESGGVSTPITVPTPLRPQRAALVTATPEKAESGDGTKRRGRPLVRKQLIQAKPKPLADKLESSPVKKVGIMEVGVEKAAKVCAEKKISVENAGVAKVAKVEKSEKSEKVEKVGVEKDRKEMGRDQQLSDLMRLVRTHIRKSEFDYAEQAANVLRVFCEKEGIPFPKTLKETKTQEEALAEATEGAEDAPKGDPIAIARDVLNRVFPLKIADYVTMEADSEVIPVIKRKGPNRKSFNDDVGMADCGEDGVAEDLSKLEKIQDAENEDYLRLHSVAHGLGEYLLEHGGCSQEESDDLVRCFSELFQLDDKSFEAMASAAYFEVICGDRRHREVMSYFAKFWSARPEKLPEPPKRLATGEERSLATESGTPPGYSIQVFHRTKRADLVVLTDPDGQHMFLTKEGIKSMMSSNEDFAAEKQKGEDQTAQALENRKAMATDLDRRRRYEEERKKFLLQGSKDRLAAREVLIRDFERICLGQADGMVLKGLPADCRGTFIRLDALFEGRAAYARFGTDGSGFGQTFCFWSNSRGAWVIAGALDVSCQPFAYIACDVPQPTDVDRDGFSWMLPTEASVGGGFQEVEGAAWCQPLSRDQLTSNAFKIIDRTGESCPSCNLPSRDGLKEFDDEFDDVDNKVERLKWLTYDDVPDATEEEKATYPAILKAFYEDGYPYLTGVRKLMALYVKSPAAMATEEFHALVRNDPVNAICNGFDSSSIIYLRKFWLARGHETFTPPVEKTELELNMMSDKERKSYLNDKKKFEVDPSQSYMIKEQAAVLQDLQIDIPLNRLIADVTENWKEDLDGFLSQGRWLAMDVDASGLRGARCGADLFPDPTEQEWKSWSGTLRAFDDATAKKKVCGPSKHTDALQTLISLHGKAPRIFATERYSTVVTWEFGKDSVEVAAISAFKEFWDEQEESGRWKDPLKGLLFVKEVPAKWCVPSLAKISELKRMRSVLQLPVAWHLELEPAFKATEPGEEGGRVFTDMNTLKLELQAQLEARQQEQRRKDVVAREWDLPARYEVEFHDDGSPYIVGPDGIIFNSPEAVPRPTWHNSSGSKRSGQKSSSATTRTVTVRDTSVVQQMKTAMLEAANSCNFKEAIRLKQDIELRKADPKAYYKTVVRKVPARSAAEEQEIADEAAEEECADEQVASAPVVECSKVKAGGRPIVKIEDRCRGGQMPIKKRVEGGPKDSKETRKYTKNAGLKQLQEKQIETGELMLKARNWRVVGIRNSDGTMCSVEDATETNPANVTCVLVQIGEEITEQEKLRVKKQWGLEDGWEVQVRIRLSGNQITVWSPEGRAYSRQTQVVQAAKARSKKLKQIQETQCLSELMHLVKDAQGMKAHEISGTQQILNGIYMSSSASEYKKCCNTFSESKSSPVTVALSAKCKKRWEYVCDGAVIATVFGDSPFSQDLKSANGGKLECTVKQLDARQVVSKVVSVVGAPRAKVCKVCSRGSCAPDCGSTKLTDRKEGFEAKLRDLNLRRKDAPRNLEDMTHHMVQKVRKHRPECLDAIRDFFKNADGTPGVIRLGTLCSGTDSPGIALGQFVVALNELFDGPTPVQFEHVFSCEFDEKKQEFLQRNFDMQLLFQDCTQMGRQRAWDVQSQSVQPVPGEIDVLCAGFSCKDLSFMNSYRKTLEEMGQSGATLRGCLDYIERYRPRVVMLENVYAIDRADQHGLKQVNIVMEGLRARGYVAGYSLCNSCDYYVPQIRHRIWMWGYRVSKEGPRKTMSDSEKDAIRIQATNVGNEINPQVQSMLRFLEEPSALHFEDCMLADEDPRVIEFLRQQYARKDAKGKDQEEGSGEKKGRSKTAKLTWEQKYSLHRMKMQYQQERPYTSERGAAWKKMLNDRTKELLDLKCLDVMNEQSIDPREVPMLWDLAQSVERVPGTRVRRDRQNYATCILPTPLWHTSRHRFLLGIEKLALQGIFPEDLQDTAFPQNLLGDLAGNAFTSTVCLANLMCAAVLADKAANLGCSNASEESCTKKRRLE